MLNCITSNKEKGMSDIIWLNILILGGIALFAAIMLYITAQKFSVQTDEKEDQIDEVLPQANCGGCGFAGCRDFARACLRSTPETFSSLYCPVGKTAVMQKVGDILGYSAPKRKESCAVLRCNGNCQAAPQKINYSGLKNCRVAHLTSVGESECPDGCLRFGDCVSVCKFGALSIDKRTGLPVVDANKCTSCGACVNICPRHLFEIRTISEDNQLVYVACNNKQKGAIARKNCQNACIACKKCSLICPEIKIEQNLSYIPESISPQDFGQNLKENCPTKAIIYKTQVKTGKK